MIHARGEDVKKHGQKARNTAGVPDLLLEVQMIE
jgi:hypothetical protein